MDPAMMSYGTPASVLESAGRQDEVIRLKGALNEKEMELIELREQHMQLVARSQEARANWETALDAKDRAIGQLEEALASRQRALEAAGRQSSSTQEEAAANLAAAQARIREVEAALAQAHGTVMSQSEVLSEQNRQLDAARQAAGQEAAAAEARVRAVQQELASAQLQQEQLQREVKQLRALEAEKDDRLSEAAKTERQLKQQLEQLQQHLQEAEAEYKQQPSRLQQQIAELNHQLEVVQHRAAAKEASSRKYKEAVRAFKTKLQERDDALAQRQSQVLELHTELSQLQRLFKMGPAGAVRSSTHLMSAPGSPGAAWGARDSGGVYSPTRAGVRLGSAGSRSAPEEVLAAATDEVERLRVEVHGFHLEMGALQAQVAEKDALLQRALADTAALDHDRGSIAARAEEATQAAFNLEKQLREARQSLEETEKRRATVAEKLAAAEARCEGLQSDQARWIRAEGALRAQVEELQEQLSTQEQQQSKLLQQAKEVAQKESDANRRIQQLESRAETLEAKLDASSSEAGQLMRRADRHENATSTLQAQLEAASRQAKEFAQALLNTESRLRDSNRQNIDLQHSCEELARKCDAADRARQQLQEQLTAAESRIATADRRAADLDSQLLLLGRALREAEGAALEWQGKARQAEQARQDIGNMVAGSEKAVQQLQSDLAQLQLSHSSERSQAQQQQDQLRSALSEAQAAKTAAELRLMEAEKQLADVRASLSSQERLLGVLRQQAAEDGSAVQQVAELHNTVQMLENALAEQRRTVQQLRTAAAASQAEQQATVQGLLAELSDKSNQLVDAERRFSQLESLMQRIASRTGQGAALGQGLTTGSSGSLTGDIMGSFTGGGAAAAAQPQQQQQRGVGAGGLGLGLTAKLQQWEQQRLSNGLRASRDFQQQTSDRWDMNGVRSAGGGGIGAGLAGPCGRCGVRGCDGGVLCAGFRGSPTRAV